MNDDYLTSAKARAILGVTSETLRNWNKQGKIRCVRTPSNQRIYRKEDVLGIAGVPQDALVRKGYLYCRVSSKKQVDDLKRQELSLKSAYPDYICITDVASGINWKRKGLKTLLERSMSGNVKEVVVAHRDRLCRFAFDLLKSIFELKGIKVTVLNESSGQSSDEELADDILSIIHVYSCRKMGQRRYKKQANPNLPDQIPKTDVNGVDSHDSICL
jgi:putative resolvase